VRIDWRTFWFANQQNVRQSIRTFILPNDTEPSYFRSICRGENNSFYILNFINERYIVDYTYVLIYTDIDIRLGRNIIVAYPLVELINDNSCRY